MTSQNHQQGQNNQNYKDSFCSQSLLPRGALIGAKISPYKIDEHFLCQQMGFFFVADALQEATMRARSGNNLHQVCEK